MMSFAIKICILSFVLMLIQAQAPPCNETVSLPPTFTRINPGSKYLKPTVDQQFTNLVDLGSFCHSQVPPLEMIGIRHYYDWISLQNITLEFKPPPKINTIVIGTGIRYRPKVIPPGYYNEGIGLPVLLVWDVTNQITQPDTNDTLDHSVCLVVRPYKYKWPLEDPKEITVNYLVAMGVNKTANETVDKQAFPVTIQHTYFGICEFPSDSDCFVKSDEEKSHLADSKPRMVRLKWTSRAWFEISDRPLSHADAIKFCDTVRHDVGGLQFTMWNAEVIELDKDKIIADKTILWGSSEEVETLAEAIANFFYNKNLPPTTTFFLSPDTTTTPGTEHLRRHVMHNPNPAVGDYKISDYTLKVEKISDAFVICVARFKEHCQQ